tara:strand:- start:99 stop:467 length:369 start_codon:yes stop_codon:yes gene_type:complete
MSLKSDLKKIPSMVSKSVKKLNTPDKMLEVVALIFISLYIISIKSYTLPDFLQSTVVKAIAVIVTVGLLYCSLPVGVMFGFAMIYSFILSESSTEGFAHMPGHGTDNFEYAAAEGFVEEEES